MSRVTGIFTGTTISPGGLSRQRPDHYAFRAGQNLPDKEFRYLRTVIVTAAVYRGFGSLLSQFPLTFRHRAGVSPYTSSFDLAQTCVFAKQLPGPILCASPGGEDPLFRRYGVSLPSSLTVTLPSALVYSTRPRVSVYGTGTLLLELSGFSREHDYRHYRLVPKDAAYCRASHLHADLPARIYCFALQPPIPSGGGRSTSPSPHRTEGW